MEPARSALTGRDPGVQSVKVRLTDRVTIRPPVGVGKQVPLDIAPVSQEQTNWCWAACAKMTTAYYDDTLPRQCDFANWLFQQTTCCQSGSSAACNKPAPVVQIAPVYAHWGIGSTFRSTQVAYTALQDQISVGYPVEIAWAWTGGGGHAVLLVGCTSDASGQYVWINDPWTGQQSLMSYADLQSGQGSGVWFATWTDLTEL
jgi:hypothetical protein